jgi:PEP-CTERM motif
MITIRRTAMACVGGLLLMCAPVRAALITFEFSGSFGSSGVGVGIPDGAQFFGSYTFSDMAGPGSGFYEHESSELRISSGGSTIFDSLITLRQLGGIRVVPGTPAMNGDPPISDQYSFLHNPQETVDWPVGLSTVTNWGFELGESDGSVFTSDALPLTPPPLSRFDFLSFALLIDGINCQGQPQDASCRVAGTLASLTAANGSTVPEPGSILLVLSSVGLALLFARRRRANAC